LRDSYTVWLSIGADLAGGLAFLSVALALFVLAWKRSDLFSGRALWLFAAFLVSYGLDRIISVSQVSSHRDPVLMVLAGLSIVFAIAAITSLWPLFQKLLILPSPGDLRDALKRFRIAKTETMDLNRWLSLGETVAHVGHWRLHQGDSMIRNSDGVSRIFGWPTGKPTVARDQFIESVLPDDRAKVIDAVDEAFVHRTGFEVSARIARPDGEIRHILLRGALRVDPSDDRLSLFGVCVDQTAQKVVEFALLQARAATEAANERLEALASRDVLTGLVNRRHFDIMLAQEFRRTRRLGMKLSLIVIGIDRFEAFGAVYGDVTAELCVVAIAAAVGGTIHRAGDLAGRLSTQGFGILLPGTDAPGAMTVAARILDAVQALSFPDAESPAGAVTISVGVVSMEDLASQQTPLSMMEQGETARQQAEDAGGNQVRAVNPVSGDSAVTAAIDGAVSAAL
jgi:diguanylate cyclase (GGDEF)-like protein